MAKFTCGVDIHRRYSTYLHSNFEPYRNTTSHTGELELRRPQTLSFHGGDYDAVPGTDLSARAAENTFHQQHLKHFHMLRVLEGENIEIPGFLRGV